MNSLRKERLVGNCQADTTDTQIDIPRRQGGDLGWWDGMKNAGRTGQ